MTTDLWTDFQTNSGRLIHKWNHYFPIYQRHFESYRNRPITFIEIGCGEGGSLAMWKRFFGPHVQIVGVDINPACRAFEEDQVAIRIGNQSDIGFLQALLDEFGSPEIVLDDGSHVMPDVVRTFGFMYGKVAKDGVYLVEDLHTAYWSQFGGGLQTPGSFIELSKRLIDELNGEYVEDGSRRTAFTRSTLSMHFYDSVVVFEKGATRRHRSLASRSGSVTLE